MNYVKTLTKSRKIRNLALSKNMSDAVTLSPFDERYFE